ncbi:MAG: acetyl-CoA hydrolase/transferase C-terminal domain-containing protein [Pseudomonadota bacterium]
MTAYETLFSWIADNAPPAPRIYVAGCSGEPQGLSAYLAKNPSAAQNATFMGVWIPGVNRTDYAGLHETARSELIFQSADFRPSFEAGRSAFRPLSYTQAWRWLEIAAIDVAIAMISSPDAAGAATLGVSADFTPALLARDDVRKVAVINKRMPAPTDSVAVDRAAFDLVIEADDPLLAYVAGDTPPLFTAIAERIAVLIDDGDTVQFGLGNVQLAVLRALSAKKNLRIHSGMISDPVLDAVDAGSIAAAPRAITTGTALGTEPLYDFCADDKRIAFRPVSYTHSITTLAAIDRFAAINSVIEVDLFGQANAEFIGGRQISGAGGLVDFLRGAAASTGGKPILALASTARGGAVSRIVPHLSAPATSVSRADVGFVVTEHGHADLRGLSIEERATALIAIAAPSHRAALKAAWTDIERTL